MKTLAALALVACTAMSCERIVYVSDGCLYFSPIRPTAEEIAAMTGETVRQILTHNETGRGLCDWQP
jgi:hypothetical protein